MEYEKYIQNMETDLESFTTNLEHIQNQINTNDVTDDDIAKIEKTIDNIINEIDIIQTNINFIADDDQITEIQNLLSTPKNTKKIRRQLLKIMFMTERQNEGKLGIVAFGSRSVLFELISAWPSLK